MFGLLHFVAFLTIICHSDWISSEGNSQLNISMAARLKHSAPLMTKSVVEQDLGLHSSGMLHGEQSQV
jgi:hypothetical protein